MGSLGETFQRSLAGGGDAPASLAPPAVVHGPAGAYTLGAVASLGAALGAVIILHGIGSFSFGEVRAGYLLLGLGSLGVMAMWLRLLGTSHGGVLAAIGAALLPATVLLDIMGVRGVAVGLAGFAAFSLGLILARGLHAIVRVAAGIMLVGAVLLAMSEALPPETAQLVTLAWLGGTALTCFALAINVWSIGRRD